MKLSKTELTRKHIIEKTADIFNKKGYAGTSLSDLTAATGLSKGSIYGNFTNKEEVALSVFEYNCSKLTDLVQKKIDQAPNFHDKLMAYANIYRKIIRGGINSGGCPILNTATEADDTNIPLKERAAAALLAWKNKIQQLIKDGITAGEFKAEVNVDQMALSIVSLIEGGVMIAKVTGKPENMDAILCTVEQLISQMKN